MVLDLERPGNGAGDELRNLRSIIALQRHLMTPKQINTLFEVACPEQKVELQNDTYPMFPNSLYREKI